MKKLFSLIHHSCFLWGMIMAASLCCWIACSDKDDAHIDEPGDPEEFSKETNPLTPQDSLEIAFMNIVSMLCQTDSTFDQEEGYTGNYKAAYGIVLYTATPTVRYKKAESGEDAKGQFCRAFTTAMEFAGAQDDGNAIRIDLGSKGNIEFELAHQDGKVGILNVDVPQIPDLTQIVWLQNEAWPQNDGDGGVTIGQTFMSSDGKRWVCIQTPESATGVLATFDDYGWFEEKFDPACNNKHPEWEGWHFTHFYSKESDWKSWLHWYASADDLLTLNRFMYKPDGSKSDKAVKVFSNTAFMDTERFNAIYTQGRYYCCGDNTWAKNTDKKHKYKLWYYSRWKDEWKEDKEEYPYIFMGNRWYVMNSIWQNSTLKDDRWDSFYCTHVLGHEYSINYSHIRDYDDNTSRNYDKKTDHNTYIKVKTYHFDGTFYNPDTQTYKDGFVGFPLPRQR